MNYHFSSGCSSYRITLRGSFVSEISIFCGEGCVGQWEEKYVSECRETTDENEVAI